MLTEGEIIFNKREGCGLVPCAYGWGSVAGCCEHGDEHSGPINTLLHAVLWARFVVNSAALIHNHYLVYITLCVSKLTGDLLFLVLQCPSCPKLHSVVRERVHVSTETGRFLLYVPSYGWQKARSLFERTPVHARVHKTHNGLYMSLHFCNSCEATFSVVSVMPALLKLVHIYTFLLTCKSRVLRFFKPGATFNLSRLTGHKLININVLIINYCKAIPLHAMEALGRRGGIAPAHSRPRH
jgi:hypothetical protein